jgi:hypothetical protein
MARVHWLAPLLYQSLDQIHSEAVPEAVRNQLRDYCTGNTRRNLYLTNVLFKLLNLFEAHGIRAVSYKGPVLAASVYGNLALREFCDLDILVHSKDVLRARDLLLSQGYKSSFHLANAQETAFLRERCEYTLWNGEEDLLVEIQWNIVPRYFSFHLDFDRLCGRLVPVSIGGRQILTLSPEDSLLILCVHGSKHRWNRLEWICGVAELIRTSGSLNWSQVLNDARRLGAQRMLFLGLFLAKDLLEAGLPTEVLQSAQADPVVKSLASQVREKLFREDGKSQGIFQSAIFDLKAKERWKDRLRYCFGLVVTPNVEDWESISLPSYLSFLYYPLRAVRLAKKYKPRPAEYPQ